MSGLRLRLFSFPTAAFITMLIFGLAGAASAWFVPRESATASGGRSWTIESGATNSALTSAGALSVSERFNVNFDGTFRGFYRDVPLSQSQTSSVTSVSDGGLGAFRPGGSAELGSYGAPGLFGTAVLPQGLRIVWHIDTAGKDSLATQYSIFPVGDRYSDADFLDVSIWGDQWQSFVKRVSGRLVLPKLLPADAVVGVSPAWLDAEVSRGRSALSVEVKDVPAKQGVRLQIRLPRGWLPGKTVANSGSAPEPPKATALDHLRLRSTRSPLFRFLAWFGLLGLIAELPIWLWLRWNRRRMRDAPWDGTGPVYEPPAGHPLVYGYWAADEQAPVPSTALVATLMDLVARGFYWRDNVRDEKTGDWRLQIALPKTPRTAETFSDGEDAVIDFVDGLLAAGPCVVDNLAGRVSPGEHRLMFKQVETRLSTEDADLKAGQKSGNLLVKAIAVVWLVIGVFGVMFLTAPSSTVPAGLVIGTFLGAIALGAWQMTCWPVGDFVRSSPELAAIQGPWRGWRDFILHFDQMETAPDLAVILWERAFAGALMWGVATEFVDRAKVLVPDLDDSVWAMGNTIYWSGALGHSMSTAAAPPSSGSFGGGGGGFGGGGGGGGGGAW